VLHAEEVLLEVELLLEDVHQHSADLLMGLVQPLVELCPNDDVFTFVSGKLRLQVVNHFASVAEEVYCLASYENLLCTFDVKYVGYVLEHKLESLGPFLTFRDSFVL
jgi:hypothetical protein